MSGWTRTFLFSMGIGAYANAINSGPAGFVRSPTTNEARWNWLKTTQEGKKNESLSGAMTQGDSWSGPTAEICCRR